MDFSQFSMGSNIQDLLTKNPDMVQEAEKLWGMLNDMSANSPEDYKKFINGVMEENKQMQKKEKEQKRVSKSKPLGRDGKFLHRFVYSVNLKTQALAKAQEGIANKFLINNDTLSPTHDKPRSPEKKFPKLGKIYMNIFQHSQ